MSQSITGRTIADRYILTGHLRASRLGDVWVARRLADQSRVLIKLLEPALFHEPEARARFEREARVLSQLAHPCVLGWVDHGQTSDGQPYLVSEYIEGETLAELLQEQGRLPPERAARIAARIALALAEAHDHGIIHRDLQPANVLIHPTSTDADGVKVLEFGLARITDRESVGEDVSLTGVGVRIGTPAYMAPEYIEDYVLDFRADLYSLGIVLYEMIVGEPPFTGRPYTVLQRQVNEAVRAPSLVVPGVPPVLDQIVLQLAEKLPGRRPASARAVAEALERGFGQSFQLGSDQGTPAPTFTVSPAPARRPAGERRDAEIDAFLRSQIHALRPLGGDVVPDRSRCLLLQEVARWSVLAEVGARAGWLIALPDAPADALLPSDLQAPYPTAQRLHLFAPNGEGAWELQTTGIDLGGRMVRTAEHIRARFDPAAPDLGCLFDLWNQGAWRDLEAVCQLAIHRGKPPVSQFLSRVFGGDQRPLPDDHPAWLYLATARIELGRSRDGFDALAAYQGRVGAKASPRIQAICAFYLGWRARRSGQDTVALQHWTAGVAWEPLDRLVAGIGLISGEPFHPHAWLGRTFPDYRLEVYGTDTEVSLAHTRAAMAPNQLIAVVTLGGFRGNATYAALMRQLVHLTTWFGGFLGPIHLITTQPERGADPDAWYADEDALRGAGVEVVVLRDATAWLQRQVKPTRVPTLFLIDPSGRVVHEGLGEPPAMWDALRRCAQGRQGPRP